MDRFDLRRWTGFEKAGGDSLQDAFIDQICIDSRRIASSHSLFAALPGRRVDGHAYVEEAFRKGAQFALVKKGALSQRREEGGTLLFVDDPLIALQQIAEEYRKTLPAQVIAITGSYGKTMAKDLLASLLRKKYRCSSSPESFNSQIGVPLSIFTFSNKDEVAIVEAGISQSGEMEPLARMIQPHAALLTPIGRKHHMTLGPNAAIVKQMMPLLLQPSCTQWILIPKESSLQSYTKQFHAPWYDWSERQDFLPFAHPTTTRLSSKIPYEILFPHSPPFEGTMISGFSYFLRLLNMALKAAALMGISPEEMKEGLREYQFEPMRQEMWESSEGALFINDVYCSDPQSIDRALQAFSFGDRGGKKICLFGGMAGQRQHHEVEYRKIGKALANAKLNALYLYGPHDFAPLMKEMHRSCPELPIAVKKSVLPCLQQLRPLLKKGDTILVKGDRKISLDLLSETVNESVPQNRCVINLAAVEANLRCLKTKLPSSTRIMAIIKAFAYGMDSTRMAHFFLSQGIDILGVSTTEEALHLRKAGISCDLFVIHAPPSEGKRVVFWNLEVGVSDALQIEAFEEEAKRQEKKLRLHLHVNTGMNRLGCSLEEAVSLGKSIQESPFLELQGLMTHMACADDPGEDEFTRKQIALFSQAIRSCQEEGISPPYTHAAASSAAVRFDLPQFNMVRIGLAAYGLSTSQAVKKALDLHLAISLISRVVAINHCKKGDTISYGRRYVVDRERQALAVLPIGYHDGLHRHYSGKGFVSIRGHLAPMVGNICMDFMMVDVTDIPGVAIGDSALIFGEDEFGHSLSPEDFASRGDSIPHELITCLGPRIERVFVYEEMDPVRDQT